MKLLDLFCGAGGAAMGYYRAGFDEIVGVDIKPQPRYPFTFVQGDALEYAAAHAHEFDAIHASPPCQAYSTIAKQVRKMRPGMYEHPDMVAATRETMMRAGKSFVIENVPGAPLVEPITLCGSSFGLDVRRHRCFELYGFFLLAPPCSHHWQVPRFRSLDKRRGLKAVVPVHGGGQLAGVVGVHDHLNYAGEKQLRERAMGIDWMNPHELTQSIPPAYTQFIGEHLIAAIKESARCQS